MYLKRILPGLVCQLSPPMNIFLKAKNKRNLIYSFQYKKVGYFASIVTISY